LSERASKILRREEKCPFPIVEGSNGGGSAGGFIIFSGRAHRS